MQNTLSTLKNDLEETVRNGDGAVPADTMTEALRLLDEALTGQVQTKILSLRQLKATIRGIAKIENFSSELITIRILVNDLDAALSSILSTLRDALSADYDVDAMNSTSEKAAVALSMVRELVAARDHALEQAVPLSINVSTQKMKPLVPASSDHTFMLHPKPARQTSAGLTGAVESENEARADDKTGKGELVQSISPLSLNELPITDGPIPTQVSITTSAPAQSSESTEMVAKQLVPCVLDEIFTAVRESTVDQQKAHHVLQLVTRLDAARETAEHEARMSRADVAAMRADVAVAWDALATPRATPTRGGVEQFADELEALLREKDATAVEAQQAVEDRRRALAAVSRAEDDMRSHIQAHEKMEAELRILQDESVGLRRHVRELADRNQKSRHKIAIERGLLQRCKDEKKTLAAREEKERRRAEALQSEIHELRSGLTRQMQEAKRSATAVKNIGSELERERADVKLLRAREEQLELKVCELADELARQDKMLANRPNISSKVTGFSTSTLCTPNSLQELEILVQELAKEEVSARRRAEEAERTVVQLKAEVEHLMSKNAVSGVYST
jgi:hypothetical protein